MAIVEKRAGKVEDGTLLAAVRAGDRGAFATLTEGYRRELTVHCYRMVGSFEDAEDLAGCLSHACPLSGSRMR